MDQSSDTRPHLAAATDTLNKADMSNKHQTTFSCVQVIRLREKCGGSTSTRQAAANTQARTVLPGWQIVDFDSFHVVFQPGPGVGHGGS